MSKGLATSRTVLITGCTRGLGRALVERFVEAGCTVWGCGTNCDAVDDVRQRFGAPHAFAVVDVRDADAVARWGRELTADGAAPDLLLNNAAVINANAPLWKVPPEDFARVMDVNLKGIHHVLAAFLPAMLAHGRGVIVNFSSGWGRSTSPEVAPYCATKYAVEGLTQALAQELPHGMCAVPLNPGIINTDMLQSCFGDNADSYPTPEKWAKKAVPFLLGIGPKDNGRPLTVPQ